ncbi:CinA family protein [Kribbella speibonae]|uniref:CinA family protein n=1 Tax=Kribbella speibonae TaxID=1572660 RepID=A0A4R0ILI3_9ACTN|nr:CinA family protein [Kribbella speibonae]
MVLHDQIHNIARHLTVPSVVPDDRAGTRSHAYVPNTYAGVPVDVDLSEKSAEIAKLVGTSARAAGLRVAVAESLTSGAIAGQLGAAPEASSWFAGGVVAYAADVKFKLLNVDPGPVVTGRCAVQMARGVAELLGADVAVAVTGVGGPDPDEDHPAGTVYTAVYHLAEAQASHDIFDGGPAQVVEQATLAALQMLREAVVPPS